MSSSIRGKRSWHDDRRRRRCAAYRLDQAPEVPLQCLRLPQLGVVHPHVQHDRSLSSPFEITGICTETSRTQAPGTQWVCTLPSANVAQTITASRSISQREAKRKSPLLSSQALSRPDIDHPPVLQQTALSYCLDSHFSPVNLSLVNKCQSLDNSASGSLSS